VDERRQFDFWLGEWRARWDGGHGTNVVTAELGGTVIFERFESTPLRGLSLSVYDETDACWKQTWADSAGGYLDFTGRFEDGTMELRRAAREDGLLVPYRMRWTEISADAFVWFWERQSRGRWETRWRIDYARSAVVGRSDELTASRLRPS
jgi:hypothetical protein